MKIVKLLHNTNAGDKAHSKEALVSQLEERGYKVHYACTKKKGLEAYRK